VPDELQNTVNALANLLSTLRNQDIPDSEIPIAAPYRLNDCGWVANRWSELLPMAIRQNRICWHSTIRYCDWS